MMLKIRKLTCRFYFKITSPLCFSRKLKIILKGVSWLCLQHFMLNIIAADQVCCQLRHRFWHFYAYDGRPAAADVKRVPDYKSFAFSFIQGLPELNLKFKFYHFQGVKFRLVALYIYFLKVFSDKATYISNCV